MRQPTRQVTVPTALLFLALAIGGCDECLVDADCAGGAVCASDGECVECVNSWDCGASEQCHANLCVADGCTSDAQCPAGFACAAGECTFPDSTCGDLVCDTRDSCSTCAQDCGECPSRTCADLPSRTFSGTNACLAVPPLAQTVVNSLITVWGTQPTYFCRYDPFVGTFTNGCGVLPPGNAMYCGIDDSVSYDAGLLNQQLEQFGTFAPIAILAHEWGHLHQARVGLLSGGRTTFQNEQHADCQAGVFAAIAEELGWLGSMDVMSAFASLCSVSDPMWHPNGHGTCDQRVNAFGHGYATARSTMQSLCEADPVQTALQICAN